MHQEEIDALIDKIKQAIIDIEERPELAKTYLLKAGLINEDGTAAYPYATEEE